MIDASAAEPLVMVRQLRKHFPVRRGVFSRVAAQVRAVDDISFDIRQGETLGLVGESGCGKTTVGRSLLRLVEPTAGQVNILGRDVTAMGSSALRALRQHMQIVFQDPYSSLNPRLTIQAILEEGLIVHGLGNRRERHAKTHDILRQVGLDPSYAHRYPHEFSGGQRQRVSIARALVLNPKFVVLDEPISALDVSIQSQVINLLIDLRETYRLTYLFISHDLSVVEYISDRVAVMYLGEIVEMGLSEDLYRRPLHPYSHALLSSIPTLDPARKRLRIVLPGDVPSPINPPSGCRFHPRCPLAMPVCRSTAPPELKLGAHQVRCHAVSEEAARVGGDAARLSELIATKIAGSVGNRAPATPSPAN